MSGCQFNVVLMLALSMVPVAQVAVWIEASCPSVTVARRRWSTPAMVFMPLLPMMRRVQPVPGSPSWLSAVR